MMKTILSGESVVLKNGELKAEVLTPWSETYCRTRFAHSGFISGLWLGDLRFTQAECGQTQQKSTGGIGLCSEYKCSTVEMDSAVGQEYLKIGVGVLVRTEKPWTIVDEQRLPGLPTAVNACDDAAVFECVSPFVNGYAYREKRTILLQGQVIRQEIELENTGAKTLDLSEYCHNFVSLGDLAIDETHRLELYCARKLPTEPENCFQTTDFGAGWTRAVQGSFYSSCELTPFTQPCAWKLTSSRTSASIAEMLDFDPASVYLWGTEYCVSAEVYKKLLIQPGETARWSREWHVTR